MTMDLHVNISASAGDLLLRVLDSQDRGFRLAAMQMSDAERNTATALLRSKLLDAMSLGSGALKSYGLTDDGRAAAETVRKLREKRAEGCEDGDEE